MDRWLTGSATEEFGLVHKLYELYKLIHLDTAKFPKTEKHALGEVLKTRLLQMIEGVWEANALPLAERLVRLEKIQRTLDLLKLFIRLVHDLGIYQTKGYLYRQERLQEIGRMLGGWKKQTRKKLGLDP